MSLNRKRIIFIIAIISVFSFSSCKVSKEYVKFISEKEDFVSPSKKGVTVIMTEHIIVNNFKKTFKNNFEDIEGFRKIYLKEFSQKLKSSGKFGGVAVNILNSKYKNLDKGNTDYVIHISSFEITSRVEHVSSVNMNSNDFGGMGNTASTEYCVINLKVEVYDAKTDKEILDFVVIGEGSVFLFNFTDTLNKAKTRSINHIVNYLNTGKITYNKY